ncbi:MAG: DUF5330 domain-containing protein [Rhizobiales bacterium]|nr:DUF5330 domain-containing protein [Hyphomicrobiales bacterium]
MRIFRTLLLLTGVAVLMPSPPDDPIQVEQVGRHVSTPGLIGSATMAFSDAASFCSRQPQVCQTAGYVADKLQAKAKYSVRLIYEWASESTAEPEIQPFDTQAHADPIRTGSTAVAEAALRTGQSSLRIEDLIPPWRGQASPKKS